MPFDYPCASDTPRKLKSGVFRGPPTPTTTTTRRCKCENWVRGKQKPRCSIFFASAEGAIDRRMHVGQGDSFFLCAQWRPPARPLKVPRTPPNSPIIFHHYLYTASLRGRSTSLEFARLLIHSRRKKADQTYTKAEIRRRFCRISYCAIQKDGRLTGSRMHRVSARSSENAKLCEKKLNRDLRAFGNASVFKALDTRRISTADEKSLSRTVQKSVKLVITALAIREYKQNTRCAEVLSGSAASRGKSLTLVRRKDRRYKSRFGDTDTTRCNLVLDRSRGRGIGISDDLGAELTKQATRKKQIAEIRDGTFVRKRDKIAARRGRGGAKSRKVYRGTRNFLRRRKKVLYVLAEKGERNGREKQREREREARTTRRTEHACSAYDNVRRSRIYDASRAQRGAKRGEEFAVAARRERRASRRERKHAARACGWFQRLNGAVGVWFPSRANGEHKGTTRAILIPTPIRESKFYVLHTDEEHLGDRARARYAFPFSVVSLSFSEFRFEFGSNAA
ncbi:hypothetical protein DBV15_06045 [Temnothorax longispinosus]|uniref:Uncharacterized protein n=1 Tax=Temnothorax longispinosus TaxID=300112 RepID=A0A4S2KZR3_9HYME|nr:hypothetical protein DBV15_06045 [Temnothorax longispinosus]